MNRNKGFTLIEIMVVITIIGLFAAVALPAMSEMMAGSKTRSLADSIASGLNKARSEALARNVPMRFQLVDTMDNTCAYSTASPFWAVTQTNQVDQGLVEGHCGDSAFNPPDQPDPCSPLVNYHGTAGACATDAFIAYKSGTMNAEGVTVTADASIVTFGPIGQVLDNIDGAVKLTTIEIRPTTGSGKLWHVNISTAGSIKVCDPDVSASTSNGC